MSQAWDLVMLCQVICSACLAQLALTKTGLPARCFGSWNIQACKEEPSETSLSLVGSGAVIGLDTCSENSLEAADTTSSSSDEAGAEFSSATRPVQQPRIPSQLKLIQHKKLKTLHLMELQNQRVMLCGRVAEPARYDNLQETRFDTPCCHMCWKKVGDYS